jgi:uncharacterized membrane protein YfcA
MVSTGAFIGGSVVLYFASSLASSGGIGGGVLNVGIFLVIWQEAYHAASVLSVATLMGNYLCQVLINVRKRHPVDKSRPLIYYEAAMALLPAELAGACVGVILEDIIPDTLLVLLAMVVLVYAISITYKKGLKMWHDETAEFDRQRMAAFDNRDEAGDGMKENDPLIASYQSGSIDVGVPVPTTQEQEDDYISISSEEMMKRKGIIGRDESLTKDNPPLVYPIIAMQIVFGSWLLYAVLYVTMGLMTSCSWEYFLVLSSIYPVLFVGTLYGLVHLVKQQKEYPENVISGDIKWAELGILPPILSFFIGILSSLLGIGGGELMGPLLLQLGVLPMVSSGTTSFMSFLNTSSSLVHYITLGDVPFATASWVFLIGAAGGTTGRSTAVYISELYNRQSILIFTLIGLLVASFCVYVYYLAVDDFDFDWGAYC